LPARRKAAAKARKRERVADRPKRRLRIWDPKKTILELPDYDPRRGAGAYRFDAQAAKRAIAWIHDNLTHVKGEQARGPDQLQLTRWQQGGIANLFGWKHKRTGLRRYPSALWFLPRKNGKSTIAAAIVNLFGFLDDEPGAEIYSAAADRDQARLVFGVASGQIGNDLALTDRARIFHNSISYDDGRAIYKALSAEAGTKHGLNSNLVVVDELHAQPTRDLVDVLVTSTGARREPLIVYITTSDFARVSICNEIVDYALKVRDGIIDDPSFLPILYAAERDDDWTAPEIWRKANPNFEVVPGLKEYLRRECQKAVDVPTFENTFRRLHLNQRTEQDVRLIPMADFDACDGDAKPEGDGFAGLDLSSTEDLTSFVVWYPTTGLVVPYFWIPAENAEARERRDRVPYLTWARQGFVELTEGNQVDYSRIRIRIGEICGELPVREIAVDPWNSAHLQRLLSDDGFDVVQYPQGYAQMNPAVRELLRRLAIGGIAHRGHPVLRWNASNVAGETSSDGQMIRPSKKKSTERIDGVVAWLQAIGRGITRGGEPPSVYDDRGLVLV
jgi:phage terminase large subunit-like protein